MPGTFTFRTKLLIAGLAVQMLAFAVLMWANATRVDSALTEQVSARAKHDAPLLNAALAAPLAQRDFATVQMILKESRQPHGFTYLVVTDRSGRVISADGFAQDWALPSANTGTPTTLPDGREVFAYDVNLDVSGQPLGTLSYGLSATTLRETHRAIIVQWLWIALSSFLVSGLLFWWVSRVLTRPLVQLSAASAAISAGDYDTRVATTGTDEIGVLATGFNTMAAEVKARVIALTKSEAAQRQYLVESQERERELAVAKRDADVAHVAKSQFLANISHELRTPLNGVLGSLQLLEFTRLDAQQLDYLKMAVGAGHDLQRVIDDVLDFSVIDAPTTPSRRVAFAPGAVIQDVMLLKHPAATKAKVSLSASVAEDVPASLLGDASRLKQALLALVDNAIKFAPQGVVSLHVLKLDEKLAFAVVDNGVGIDPANHEKIFEPFFQVDGSSTRRFGGAGLGLAIARQLARTMGGDLAVRSALGEGARFTLTVPWLEAVVEA